MNRNKVFICNFCVLDVTVVVETEKVPNVQTALLENVSLEPQPRYGNSEINQFFIILGRTLLFSRRDWVR